MRNLSAVKQLCALTMFCTLAAFAGSAAYAQRTGIGNNDPQERLDVTGPIRVRNIPSVDVSADPKPSVEFLVASPNGPVSNVLHRAEGGNSRGTLIWVPGSGTTPGRWEFGPAGNVRVSNTSVLNLTEEGDLDLDPGTRCGQGLVWRGGRWQILTPLIINVPSDLVMEIDSCNGTIGLIGGRGRGVVEGSVIVYNETLHKWEFRAPNNPNYPGKTYTGVSPIQVNATTNQISLINGGNTAGTLVWTPGVGNTPGSWSVGTPPPAGWDTKGNSDINATTDYLGTTNAQPLVMRTQGIERLRLTEGGSLDINSGDNGTTGPSLVNVTTTSTEQNQTGISINANGTGGIGLQATVTSNQPAIVGESNGDADGSTAVRGNSTATSGATFGIEGITASETSGAIGVVGRATATSGTGSTIGVAGESASPGGGGAGVQGTVLETGGPNTHGVRGANSSNADRTAGVYGEVVGQGAAGNTYYGTAGVANKAAGFNIGIFGEAPANPNNWAGYFNGNVGATGEIRGAVKNFYIDHPQDPANKILRHYSIESATPVNLYTGNVTTNASGEATVTLPAYMQALNKDFTYNLTPVGQFAQVIVLRKIEGNTFAIKSDKPNVEVSWTVTGVRQDPYVKKNGHSDVLDKGALRGKYIHPELYNRPASDAMVAQPGKNTTVKLARPLATRAQSKMNVIRKK